MRKILLLLFLSPVFLKAQNQVPQISNLNAVLDLENTNLIINYDLDDSEMDSVEISLELSDGLSPVFLINTTNASGDIGFPVLPGTGKSIIWSFEGMVLQEGEYTVRLVADDRHEINIQDLVDQVDSNRLRADMEYLCGIRHRSSGAVHLEEVKDSIEQFFIDHQLVRSRQEFAFGNYQAHNMIGLKAGTTESEQVYIMDAHFDTVSDSPGADDNASGVAGFMEALRILSNYNFRKSIKFIGFDLEEEGLVGSNRYVNAGGIPAYEQTEGVLNFEMIAYYDTMPNTQTLPNGFEIFFPEAADMVMEDEFRGNFITNVAVTSSLPLHDAFNAAAAAYVPELKVIALVSPDVLVPPDLLRSDHAHFWGAGIQALMLTDGANFRNLNYHTPDDEFNTLNFNFMTQVVQASVATIAELAGIQHSTVAETTVDIPTKTTEVLNCEINLYQDGEGNLIMETNRCMDLPVRLEIFSLNGQLIYQIPIPVGLTERFEMQPEFPGGGIFIVKLSNSNQLYTQKLFIR